MLNKKSDPALLGKMLHQELDFYMSNDSNSLDTDLMAQTIEIYTPFPTNKPLPDRQIHQTT